MGYTTIVRLHRFATRFVIAAALVACNAITGVGVLGMDDGGAGGPSSGGPKSDAQADTGPSYYAYDASDDVAENPGDGGVVGESSTSDAGKRVFTTQATMNGNLGGLAGADLKCTQAAQAAGLGGNWVAWLSTMNADAKDRVTSAGPWTQIGQATPAVTKAQLTNPPIGSELRRNELGLNISGNQNFVWTASDADGTFLDDDCEGWTSAGAVNHAASGDARTTSPAWTAAVPRDCNLSLHLYCFEL
jgi:hypothetical protein